MSSSDPPTSNGSKDEKDLGLPSYESPSVGQEGVIQEEKWATRVGLNFESFKRRGDYGTGVVELERSMKPRHLHMIAIGGSIGAGFFVGSGSALATGADISPLVYALGELAVMYPISGGFYTYATRFIDPSWGFAMGYNYVLQWAVVVPLELTVCAISISYWNQDISAGVWITVFYIFIVIVNVFGTLGYAEEEFWASILKLSATVIFMIISLICVLGGGPQDGWYSEYYGARLWYDPGAFRNGFKGFCAVFVTAAFSFSGTELVGLAAAEARNPAKALPGAIKQVFWRITLFYILGLTFVGLLIPSNDTHLLNATSSNDVTASPFVLVGQYAGLYGFNHFMNFIILVSVVSIGMSGVYGGSRTLTALAQQGYAPKVFAYVDRSGRPLASVGLLLAFGLLAYINLAAAGPDIFDWLLALSGLAALFTWGSICLAHIRFRSAWAYHGHTLDEIPFKAVGGVYGSYLGLILIVLVLIAQFYVAIAPPGQDELNDVAGFFQSYLALPVVMLFWAVGYLWKRTGWLRTHQIDVDTGRREVDWEEINAFRAHLASLPAWRRMLNMVF
ncbi:amino-acid permease inda1 [Hypoxylon rubiginosum]|uniref:Amino-acid permease inda1 n=1 Tax=Hypoxylon rubiginosum TaxID=110542 RepID=A0ACB9ZAJ3_9PEZI|nr:amino-acid permease inda1 [Hypoxylon rubiginosum]